MLDPTNALAVAQANLAAAQAVKLTLDTHVAQLQSTVTEIEQAANTQPTIADVIALAQKVEATKPA